MNRWLVNRARDNLHRLAMRTVSSYGFVKLVTAHQMVVPDEQNRIIKRVCKALVKICHHARDTELSGRNMSAFRPEAKLVAQGRLDAVAVENFPFDFCGFDRFFADQLNTQGIWNTLTNVLKSALVVDDFSFISGGA
jgi:hypothetical protein